MTEVAAEVNAAVGAAKDAHDGTSTLGVPASDTTWLDRAACARIEDPDVFFPNAAAGEHYGRTAKWICRRTCPVREECLTAALDHEVGKPAEERWGIWGGLTPQQRANLDPRRRGRGHPPTVECNGHPGRAKGVERHLLRGEDLCPPCREYDLTSKAKRLRVAAVLRLAREGKSPWQIALATGEPHSTVRGILARHEPGGRLEPDPLELVLDGQVAVGD